MSKILELVKDKKLSLFHYAVYNIILEYRQVNTNTSVVSMQLFQELKSKAQSKVRDVLMDLKRLNLIRTFTIDYEHGVMVVVLPQNGE